MPNGSEQTTCQGTSAPGESITNLDLEAINIVHGRLKILQKATRVARSKRLTPLDFIPRHVKLYDVFTSLSNCRAHIGSGRSELTETTKYGKAQYQQNDIDLPIVIQQIRRPEQHKDPQCEKIFRIWVKTTIKGINVSVQNKAPI